MSSIDVWDASVRGDLQEVLEYLNAGCDPNVPDSTYYCPLHHAARRGHRNVIEALLRGGGRVNIQTQYGETPLHCAFSTGRYECILLLLCRGADPSLKEFRGRIPAEVAYSDAEAAGAATPEELVRVQQLQFLMEELPGQLHHVHVLLQAADVASAAAAEAAADATADADST
eukprot:6335-Heterococcus_DN1.PRE.1